MLQDFTLPDFDEIVTIMKYIFRFQLSAHVCLGIRRLYSIYIGILHVGDNAIKSSGYSTEHVSGI